MGRLSIIVVLLVAVIALAPPLQSDSLAKKATYACGDGIDNDGSGQRDYPEDVDGCQSPDDDTEADLPVTTCSDGYDNDLDGRTDYPDDAGCRTFFDDSETGGKKPPG